MRWAFFFGDLLVITPAGVLVLLALLLLVAGGFLIAGVLIGLRHSRPRYTTVRQERPFTPAKATVCRPAATTRELRRLRDEVRS